MNSSTPTIPKHEKHDRQATEEQGPVLQHTEHEGCTAAQE
jgi:hypothetical protein